MIKQFAYVTPEYKNDFGQDQSDLLMCEIGKILQAAVINTSFREELLGNPLKSIENGYFGEKFEIPEGLLKKISGLRTNTLDQFTTEVLNLFNTFAIPEYAKFVY